MAEPERGPDLDGAASARPAAAPGVDAQVFEAIFEAHPDALLVVGPSGSIATANPAAAALLHYTADELAGMPVEHLVPDASRARHAGYRAAYARAPQRRPMGTRTELAARRKDGTEVVVEIALSPMERPGSHFVLAAIRDIGDYPRVKQALKRARYSDHLAQLARLTVESRDLPQIVQRMPEIVASAQEVEVAIAWLLDRSGSEFRLVGGIGMPAGEAVGLQLANRPDCLPGIAAAQAAPVLVPDLRAEMRFPVPQAWLDAGLRSALAVPLADRGKVIGILSVRSRVPHRFGDDEVRFLESAANLLATTHQRLQSEEQLDHAQRLESIGQLTGGVAHDFNNLLTIVQGNLQVLEDLPAVAGDPEALRLLQAAMRAAGRGAALTGKLLAFSRRQRLRTGRVDLRALLESLCDMLGRTLDRRIHVTLHIAPGCPAAWVDASQLESALLNLAINARDAMPGGGDLGFRAYPIAETAGAQDAGRRPLVAIAVTDTGAGMDEETKKRAFEPFFTTKPPGRGTGLGLSTVYGFASQSHGHVVVESAPGAGTTVTLCLPCDDDRTPADGTRPAPPAFVRRAGARALLVEDDPEVRKVVCRLLRSLDYDVEEAASGEEALALLQAGAPRFDLLLSDVSLGPGLQGTALAAQALQIAPGLPTVLMSGYSAELMEADRQLPAGCELLHKPFSRAELVDVLARVDPRH
ncbi:MAG: histidine kinase [Variovorax paradoxus]|uniref:histidine kinase n=1 Tax=Variovorax paradoxus TaxID=34073 RepID=A0A2W5S3E6_VARPD|nr:MAG: histidine kinase [Variovorax paradoxus]